MELTIEHVLKQAVEAHKAGKLQDAEALYRAILQTEPKHPDANHNLGVLAVSLNKSELALPLFKTALEVNSKQVQFWISYVDALIKTNQLEIAKSVLEQGKKLGLAGERVDALEAQLTPITVAEMSESIIQKQPSTFTHQRMRLSAKKENKKNSSSNQTNPNQVRSPSQVEVNSLLEHYQKGRFDLAENLAKTITQKYPNHQFTWKVLGALFQITGRLQESLIAYQRAVEISPNDAKAHYNLGITLQELGRLEDAEASYSKAIAIKPKYAQAYNNLGNTLQELGRLEDAEAIYKKAVAIKPEFAEAHNNLGTIYIKKNLLVDAIKHIKIALEHSPKLIEAQSNEALALSKLIPGWHVPMVNENMRNDAYYSALEAVIKPNSLVFEIGTGSGLLAMMAAKLKAKKVSTCESNTIIAEKAFEIITNNGYGKAITLISKKSTDVSIGDDLSEKSNVLVSEIFSSELLSEYVLPAIEDAKRRLLTPDVRIIPATGSIMIALFGGEDIKNILFAKDYRGIKIEEFNSIVSKKIYLLNNHLPIKFFTDEVEAFRFEFEKKSYFPRENKTLQLQIKSSGLCHGIIQWIRLEMTNDILYENNPTDLSSVSGWQHIAYLFKEPIEIKAGHTAVVTGSHNRIDPWFSLQTIKGLDDN